MSAGEGPRRLPRRPLIFEPQLRTRVWGGDYLRRRSPDPPEGPIGESWEISDEDGAITITAEGWCLRDLMHRCRDELVGRAYNPTRPHRFPLLLKLLDARADLSVQVHPDDERAAGSQPGAVGKTECWYVLDAAEEARIYRGVKPGTTPEQFSRAAEEGEIGDLLHQFPVHPGDAVFVPAGTVHAIGAGVRLVEIQQTCDITYRVFDWNRLGMDGRPRPLHLEQAMQVIEWRTPGPDVCEARPIDVPGCRARELVADPKLRVRELTGFGADPVPLDTGGQRFHIVTVISGTARVEAADGAAERGVLDSALLPAAAGRYTLTASDNATILLFDRP